MNARSSSIDIAFTVGAQVGESPVWDDREEVLVFIDVRSGKVHEGDIRSGEVRSFSTPTEIGTVALCEDGGLICALIDGIAVAGNRDDQLTRIPSPVVDIGAVRFNDGKIDPWGRLVVGTTDLTKVEGRGCLFALSSDRSVVTLLKGVNIANGLDWSADRTTMYYIDSSLQSIDAFDIRSGSLTLDRRRRVISIADRDGMPDGMTLDAEGCLWIALYRGGKVCRFTPAGSLDQVVSLPTSNPTSVAFGGTRLQQLFITTARRSLSLTQLNEEPHAGDVFVLEPSIGGSLPNRFIVSPEVGF